MGVAQDLSTIIGTIEKAHEPLQPQAAAVDQMVDQDA
jgi:hypothetical protein